MSSSLSRANAVDLTSARAQNVVLGALVASTLGLVAWTIFDQIRDRNYIDAEAEELKSKLDKLSTPPELKEEVRRLRERLDARALDKATAFQELQQLKRDIRLVLIASGEQSVRDLAASHATPTQQIHALSDLLRLRGEEYAEKVGMQSDSIASRKAECGADDRKADVLKDKVILFVRSLFLSTDSATSDTAAIEQASQKTKEASASNTKVRDAVEQMTTYDSELSSSQIIEDAVDKLKRQAVYLDDSKTKVANAFSQFGNGDKSNNADQNKTTLANMASRLQTLINTRNANQTTLNDLHNKIDAIVDIANEKYVSDGASIAKDTMNYEEKFGELRTLVTTLKDQEKSCETAAPNVQV